MVERKRIGFIFSYNENWIGGSYYIINIIHALSMLNIDEQPEIVIITDDLSNVEILKKETNYQFLDYILFVNKLSFFEKFLNKIFNVFQIKKRFTTIVNNPRVDLIYPYNHDKVYSDYLSKIYWIPDFQEEFLPELFSEKELIKRKKRNSFIANNADLIVFSSADAEKHFKTFYPNSKSSTYVLKFAVTHPDITNISTQEVLEKYKLPEKYFFTPNQFWIHKNHITVLKAIKELKDKGKNVFVAFSGKDYDYRNKDYVNSLKEYIKSNDLNDNITFLGFIDRKDQLVIMKESTAIIQPSLFEGWSTVVEDSKALNKHIILSDLDVHKEQIDSNCDFFERNNYLDLSMKIEKKLDQNIDVVPKDYIDNIKSFGEGFFEIIKNFSN